MDQQENDKCSSPSTNDDDDDYEEPPLEFQNIHCLFCSQQSSSYEDFFTRHLPATHHISDFIFHCKSAQLGTFQFIKLINYVRQYRVPAEQFEMILQTKPFDQDDDHLKPILEDDQLLMFDYESEIEDADQEEMAVTNHGDDREIAIRKSLSRLSAAELIDQILALRSRITESQTTIDALKLLLNENEDENPEDRRRHQPQVTGLNEQSDVEYINSYSHTDIHHQMLADKPRTKAYQDAILENCAVFKNKTVLDIGCGVGILSLFAAKAGARLVVAVDQSDIIYQAKSIIYENDLDDRIRTVKGKLEQVDFKAHGLPTQYDIIVSEWMGYFLLYEGMLDTVLYARDKLLIPKEGLLLPNRCKLFLAAFSNTEFYNEYVDFWKNVYGFQMKSMIPDVISEAAIYTVQPKHVCSSEEKLCEFDLTRCTSESVLEIRSSFDLRFPQSSIVHGFVGWFDCFFEAMPKLVVLSTSPFSEPTHWKQTVFLFPEPVWVTENEGISGEILIQREQSCPRNLQVTIRVRKPKELNLHFSLK